MSPAVSVIIPVYNVAPYLARCLDSLCSQSLSDLEFICIDDASPDNSLQILRQYAEKDPRVKVISMPQNGGAARARNAGLDAASGEYLSFVDPDDAVSPDFYAVLYRIAKKKNADIAKGLYKKILSENESKTINNGEIRKKGVWYFTSQWQSAIYRRKLLADHGIRFADEIIKAQDVVFLNRITMLDPAPRIALTNDVHYCYYRRDDSLDSSVLSLPKLKSDLSAQQLILQNMNSSRLFARQPFAYAQLYGRKLSFFLNTIFWQCGPERERKELCIDAFIENYHRCVKPFSMHLLFRYRFLFPGIKCPPRDVLIAELEKYDGPEAVKQASKRYKMSFPYVISWGIARVLLKLQGFFTAHTAKR
ncbi:MAG: glycosyltransferase [Victivallaceae bacterium]|nr:glycosyltransferase [Victivallaceae bacterium]